MQAAKKNEEWMEIPCRVACVALRAWCPMDLMSLWQYGESSGRLAVNVKKIAARAKQDRPPKTVEPFPFSASCDIFNFARFVKQQGGKVYWFRTKYEFGQSFLFALHT